MDAEKKPWSACWLGIHAWSKWGNPHEVEVCLNTPAVVPGEWTFTSTEPPTWREIWQSRVCHGCGALQNREVRKVKP